MNRAEPLRPTVEEPTDAAKRPLPRWIATALRWCVKGLWCFVQFLLMVWGALAIYYSNLPGAGLRTALAVVFAGFGVWALWVSRRMKTQWIFAAVFLAVLIWWVCIPPSNNRSWAREVAVLPRATIDGDRVRIDGYRHFTYRSVNDFDVRYEQREVSLAHLVSVDLFISYWAPGPVGHTFVSFNFDDGAPPVCISIETRPEVGESYDPIGSMFKQFELIYVVGDERDLVRVRTDHRKEEVFLYHIRASGHGVRRFFEIYLERINQLADRPEWYHLLSDNCTLNVIRYSRAAGGPHGRFDHRHWLNGLIDRYLYGLGILDTSLSFEELRRRSEINEPAHAAGDAEDFSVRIRAALPGLQPATGAAVNRE